LPWQIAEHLACKVMAMRLWDYLAGRQNIMKRRRLARNIVAVR
jgi:hypothetical protein